IVLRTAPWSVLTPYRKRRLGRRVRYGNLIGADFEGLRRQTGAPTCPHAPQRTLERCDENVRPLAGRLPAALAHSGAQLGQRAAPSRPVQAPGHEIVGIEGDELVKTCLLEQSGTLSSGGGSPGYRKGGHAHPECVISGRTAVVRDGIEAQIYLVMQGEIGIDIAAGMKGKSPAID